MIHYIIVIDSLHPTNAAVNTKNTRANLCGLCGVGISNLMPVVCHRNIK